LIFGIAKSSALNFLLTLNFYKEKMNFEKAKHEREEMRDRYSAMDAVVRSEF
jgi:hypothetical protein